MRIIAGSARRAALEVAAGSGARPMLEMARGALFNSLGNRLAGVSALDLYAGSGALGLEALSRGAGRCLFVERNAASGAALARNAAKCRLEDRSEVRLESVESFLAGAQGGYGLVFLDPPFSSGGDWRADGGLGTAMRALAGIMAGGGTLILRLERSLDPPEWPGLAAAGAREYGHSRICHYRKEGAAAGS